MDARNATLSEKRNRRFNQPTIKKEVNKMNDGGKGSSPRPFSVSNEEYAKRWDAIFGKDLKEDIPVTPEEDEAWKELEEKQKEKNDKPV